LEANWLLSGFQHVDFMVIS